MKEKFITKRWNDIFSIVVLIVTAVLVTIVLTGLVEVGFESFTTLVVIGGVGWGVGEFWNNSVRFVRRGWGIKKRVKHPLTIAGMILGVITLLIIISTYNSTLVFVFIRGYFEAFIALAILIFVLIGLNLRRNVIAPS